MDTSVYTSSLESRVQHCLSQMYSVAECNSRVWCRLRKNPSSQAYFELSINHIVPRDRPANIAWGRELYKSLRKFPCTKGTLKVMLTPPKSAWSETLYGYGSAYLNEDYNLNPTPQVWGNLVLHGGLLVRLEGHFDAPELESDLMTTIEWYYNGL